MSVNVATGRTLRPAALLLAASALAAPAVAWADCTADSTGAVVTCSGTSAAYANTAAGVGVTVQSGAAVTGPLQIGDNGTLANSGSITSIGDNPAVLYGASASINNGGTISSTATTSNAAGIVVGDNSTVTNNGALTATAGTPAVSFGVNGTFTNTASATAAITGNIAFGTNTGSNVGSFVNSNTAFGLAGNVTGAGNLAIDNAGLFSGGITQTSALGTVVVLNESGGTYSGIMSIGDAASVSNRGAMTLLSGSGIGTLGLLPSNLVNTGTLTLGSTATPATVAVSGSFAQGSTGTLTIAIRHSSTDPLNPGTGNSLLHLTGVNGTAALDGTLALTINPAYYRSGANYVVVLADQGISGNFANITGNSLPFISFVPIGVVTIGGTQQAYELQAQRTASYASAIASVATPNQLAVANGMQALVTYADANSGGTAGTLVGQLDVLTVAQAQTFLDTLSPAGYLAYANALHDQANMFGRQIALRLNDHNSDDNQPGVWGSMQAQFVGSQASSYDSKGRLMGLNIGYDYAGKNFVVGAAAGFSWDKLHNSDNSLTGKNRMSAIAAYGRLDVGPLDLAGQIAGDFGSLNAVRTLTAGSTTTTLDAATKEHLFKATGTAGFALKADGFRIEPFAGIDWMTGRVNGFTETNSLVADLAVSPISLRRSDLLLGLDLSRDTGIVRPYVHATYRSQMGSGGDSTVTAAIQGITASTFTVAGTPAARRQLDADAGVNLVWDDSGSLFFGYEGTMASGHNAHGIDVGLRLAF